MQRTQALVPGVIADIIIPFSGQEEPDWDRLVHEVKVLDESGVHAVGIGGVLGGTIGAPPDELCSLCRAVKRSSKRPLFVTLFPDASPEAFEMVRAVEEGGADALLVGQPHYLAQPGVEGLEEMFATLRELTQRPLLVAECLPGSVMGASSIRRLIERRLVDGVLEGADMHVLVDLLCARVGVPVYGCVEDLHYAALVLGAHGLISNLASVFPQDCVELYAAVQDRDHLKARKIHERLVRLWRALSCGTEREARLRSALASRGRPVGAARSPYGKLPPEASQQISSILKKEGIPLVGR
ncbi:MAG: dihydrodipicolinate synthase family protein [Candidatus Sulfotelmatobacter sp.]